LTLRLATMKLGGLSPYLRHRAITSRCGRPRGQFRCPRISYMGDVASWLWPDWWSYAEVASAPGNSL
jgi:hypothetical protein